MSKYHNQKIRTTAGVFDSRGEWLRWRELEILYASGRIADLRRQVKYELIPTLYAPDQIDEKGHVRKGRVLEHSVIYVADFVYFDVAAGETVVEDFKGVKTDAYVIKRKLMLYKYGIRVREVKR